MKKPTSPVDARSPRPDRAALEAARTRRVADVVAPDLAVLFCGINPGLYTAAVGHHFGRPGNRFWPALFASGFTPRRFAPGDQAALLGLGLGITNLVARTTATADELSPEEIVAGYATLARKLRRLQPRCIAFLGVTAYRVATRNPRASLGRQPAPLSGALVWVLPNPSGLNAHHQPDTLARLFRELRDAVARS